MTARTSFWRSLLASVAASALFAPVVSAIAQEKVGAATAVNPDTSGTPPGAAVRQMMIGQDVVHNERITTGDSGQTQLLFLDESTLTVGPNAEMTIDNFVFDPSTSTGQLAMSATQGVFRYVGGAISKHENAVTLHTPAGALGIRGGVFLASLTKGGRLDVVFLYGVGLTVTPACPGCPPQTITRPGFFVSIPQPGAPASSPAPASVGYVGQLLAVLNGRNGGTAGSHNPPTDAALVNSGLPGTLSGNPAASDSSALHSLPPFTPPPDFNPVTIQTTTGQNNAFSRGHATIKPAFYH